MRQNVELGNVASGIRRRWWIPVLLGLVGVNFGVVAAMQVPAVYRSEATLLVGPLDGQVTYSSTIRASEDEAAFYADMARRQVVLQPVVKKLGNDESWDDLRDDVSAVVPTQNLRLVTVTVLGDAQAETQAAANAIIEELVSLSPSRPDDSERTFVNEQVEELKQSIESAQLRIKELTTQIDETSDSSTQETLQRQMDRLQANIGEWQSTYVDLVAVEPSSDAGGLRVLDEATPVTGQSRLGLVKQGVVGGLAGVILGMLGSWLLYRQQLRRNRPRKAVQTPMGPPDPDEAVVRHPQPAARDGSNGAVKELTVSSRPLRDKGKGAVR